MNSEPDLFSWQGPPAGGATVLVFPLARWIGKARTTAAVVMRCKSQQTQQAAFDRAALALTRRLRLAGIDEAEVAHQIDAFARTVNAEIARLQHGRQQA
jgi:hypothetical protein